MAWSLFDHTADVGIRSDGDDVGDALAQAARGLTAVITGKKESLGFRSGQERTFFVEAPDHQALVVAFLSELLWLAESEGLLWVTGGVDVRPSDDGLRAEAAANMIPFDNKVHRSGVEVKAITYHQLFSGREGDRWSIRVILDI